VDGETAAPAKAQLPNSETDEMSDNEFLAILREHADWQASAGSSACPMSDAESDAELATHLRQLGLGHLLNEIGLEEKGASPHLEADCDATAHDDADIGPSRPPPAASAEGSHAARGVKLTQVRNALHTSAVCCSLRYPQRTQRAMRNRRAAVEAWCVRLRKHVRVCARTRVCVRARAP
jgi:hypothetical protein